MATIVKSENFKGAHPFPETLGKGLGTLAGGYISRRIDEKRKGRLATLSSQMLKDVMSAQNSEEAMQVAGDPQYGPLFEKLEDYKVLGEIIRQRFPEQEIDMEEFSFYAPDLGKQTVKVPKQDMPDVSNPDEIARFLTEMQAPSGSSLFGREKPLDTEPYFKDALGQEELGMFVPGEEPIGSFSQGEVTNLLNKLRLEEQRRDRGQRAAETRTGVLGSEPAEEARAGALLQSMGRPMTPENVRWAMATEKQIEQELGGLEKYHRLDVPGVLDKVEGDIAGKQYGIERALLREVVKSGNKTPQQAAVIARKAAEALVPKQSLLDIKPKEPDIKPQPGSVSQLKEGGVYYSPTGERYVYIGRDENGSPKKIVIE